MAQRINEWSLLIVVFRFRKTEGGRGGEVDGATEFRVFFTLKHIKQKIVKLELGPSGPRETLPPQLLVSWWLQSHFETRVKMKFYETYLNSWGSKPFFATLGTPRPTQANCRPNIKSKKVVKLEVTGPRTV